MHLEKNMYVCNSSEEDKAVGGVILPDKVKLKTRIEIVQRSLT